MNASEQAKTLETTAKIASVVNLFKQHFPDAKADLKPWQNDPDTIELVDPNSIDIGFHFPGWSRKLQSRSILVQIRFHQDLVDKTHNFIGIETAGFNHSGEVWRFSTIESWQLEGKSLPTEEIHQKLRLFCQGLFELF